MRLSAIKGRACAGLELAALNISHAAIRLLVSLVSLHEVALIDRSTGSEHIVICASLTIGA